MMLLRMKMLERIPKALCFGLLIAVSGLVVGVVDHRWIATGDASSNEPGRLELPSPPTVSLTMSTTGEGRTGPAVGKHTYTYSEGRTVSITAEPAAGWIFSEWVGSAADRKAASTTVTMDEDKTIRAVFIHVTEIAGTQTSHTAGGVPFHMRQAPAAAFPMGTHDHGTAVVDTPFWIAETLVTYELWYVVRQWALRNGYAFANAGLEGSTEGGGSHPNFANTGNPPTSRRNEPVTMISWRDSIVWCNALSEMLGYDPVYTYQGTIIKNSNHELACDNAVQEHTNGFRLPTSEEWELAARYKGADSSYGAIPLGGLYWTPWDYASGATANADDAAATHEVAWYDTSKTWDVGLKRANGLGLYDMSGNAWEWCFTQSASIYRERRGGSWWFSPVYSVPLMVGYVAIGSHGRVCNQAIGLRLARTHEDHTLEPGTYLLTMEKAGEGTVTPAEGTYVHAESMIVPISVQAASGWQFVGWESGADEPNAAQTTVTMNSSETVRAVFAEIADPGASDSPEQIHHTVGRVGFAMRLAPAATFPTLKNDSGSATVDHDFWIAETPVTYALWYAVRMWALDNGYNFANQGREGSDGAEGERPSRRRNEPVTRVNWYDSIVWCNALSEYLGRQPVYTIDGSVLKNAEELTDGNAHQDVKAEDRDGFRLPSSMEWELAARYKGRDPSHGAVLEGGLYWTPGNYASGAAADYNNQAATQAAAWYGSNSDVDGSGRRTQDVGQKPASGNGLGLFDMSGNINEWCFCPTLSGSHRIRRGGPWGSHGGHVLVGVYNSSFPPAASYANGLRLARTHF